MAVTSAYLVTVKNLSPILAAMRGGQSPERYTMKYLAQLGFPSSSDRAMVPVLKGLGFINDDGVPTQRYYDYLDETQHRSVMGQAVLEAYADLFKVNSKAYEMSPTELIAKLKTLTQGAKGNAVLKKMATTFLALCKEASFAAVPPKPGVTDRKPSDVERKPALEGIAPKLPLQLSYVINVELPLSKDQAVYEAIFRALKEHLL